jgi:predicted glutamine amidotransferase
MCSFAQSSVLSPQSFELIMCRLLIVRSQESFDPRGHLMRFASLCRNSKEFQGHGWGCAWKEEGRGWQIYRNLCPVWDDDYSRLPRTNLLVAHARSAFEDKDICVENNMPFTDGERIFIFNGELRGVKIREEGRIGAEKIFNFIRRFDSGDTLGALKKATGLIRNRTRHIRAMNIIMVKEHAIYLSTFFTGDEDYFTIRYKEGSELVVCSEAYPSEEGWQCVANGTVREW